MDASMPARMSDVSPDGKQQSVNVFRQAAVAQTSAEADELSDSLEQFFPLEVSTAEPCDCPRAHGTCLFGGGGPSTSLTCGEARDRTARPREVAGDFLVLGVSRHDFGGDVGVEAEVYAADGRLAPKVLLEGCC